MYCIVSENGEEVNTGKGVNISIKFKEYEMLCLTKNNKTQNENSSKQTT